jgi:hypothetical protein
MISFQLDLDSLEFPVGTKIEQVLKVESFEGHFSWHGLRHSAVETAFLGIFPPCHPIRLNSKSASTLPTIHCPKGHKR